MMMGFYAEIINLATKDAESCTKAEMPVQTTGQTGLLTTPINALLPGLPQIKIHF
jgi:hypothetical protein